MALKASNVGSPMLRMGRKRIKNKYFGGKIVAKQNYFYDKIIF